jgi:hypothetical protein
MGWRRFVGCFLFQIEWRPKLDSQLIDPGILGLVTTWRITDFVTLTKTRGGRTEFA